MNKIFSIFLILFYLYSCSGIDFVYKESSNLTNPLYNKTQYIFNGQQIPSIQRFAGVYFGKNKDNEFLMKVNISEEKIKKSIESNQAVLKIDYELTFKYLLYNQKIDCLVLEKGLSSKFSYTPKSAGYNFGSDKSLDKLYELSVKDNFSKFTNSLSGIDFSNCIDEG